ncbi:MAG: hypothetical protein M3R60_12140 [Pseudomonadota bacterium]|nr:hypothetical protein [Pseudomonadota bacterium]
MKKLPAGSFSVVGSPDHAHAIWTLPPGDRDCASRWRAVKIAFSKALRKAGAGNLVWERHYRDHRIDNDADYGRLVDYVHNHPMRQALRADAAEWQWSSLYRLVAARLSESPVPPS